MANKLADLLPSSGRVAVMGIINITPDSFSDGGQLLSGSPLDLDLIKHRAESMLAAGVDILDVGGESTRPGATPVSSEEELSRVLPVIEALKTAFSCKVSVDTSNPEVMSAAAQAGVDLINDVRSLTRPNAIDVAVKTGLPVCLMHMSGEPGLMQLKPEYKNVLSEVKNYLVKRAEDCIEQGIERDNILIDPGFGFGKNLEHNLQLFRGLPELASLEFPLLVGVSRKRMIGDILNKPVSQRMIASVALALLAAQAGAKIVRVHDVEETVDALKMMRAVE